VAYRIIGQGQLKVNHKADGFALQGLLFLFGLHLYLVQAGVIC
jgi:hypothetical protein